MPYDKRRSNQTVFMEKHCPCGNRNAAGLHLQICLHEGLQNRLYVVVDRKALEMYVSGAFSCVLDTSSYISVP